MSHYYLAPYVGTGVVTGTAEDPFRPRGSDQSTWHAIDLRPDGSAVDGFALVVVPERDDEGIIGDGSLGVYLGDSLDEASGAVKGGLGSKLGITLKESTPRDIIFELLNPASEHAAKDGTRWRPFTPTHQKRTEIWLGEKLWDVPVIKGGSLSETWGTANSDSLTSGQTWSEDESDIDIVSNTARTTAVDVIASAHITTSLTTNDMYAQADILASTGGWQHGVQVRKHATAATLTAYIGVLRSASDTVRAWKVVSGSLTLLDSDQAVGAGLFTNTAYLIKLQLNGTTFSTFLDTVAKHSFSDSSIDGSLGKKVGIWSLKSTDGYAQWDNFLADDLAAAVTRGRPFGTRGTAFNGGRTRVGNIR